MTARCKAMITSDSVCRQGLPGGVSMSRETSVAGSEAEICEEDEDEFSRDDATRTAGT